MTKKHDSRPDKPGVRYIFRPWITGPDGKRIYASQFGKRAFRIPVDDNES